MSNWKKAYGWRGHIIQPHSEGESAPKDNVVSVPTLAFLALVEDYNNCKLDKRIQSKELGITSDGEYFFMAVGTAFSEGFTHYGTPFVEAEGPPSLDADAKYHIAMKEIYGINLPPSRLMVGCSSEH